MAGRRRQEWPESSGATFTTPGSMLAAGLAVLAVKTRKARESGSTTVDLVAGRKGNRFLCIRRIQIQIGAGFGAMRVEKHQREVVDA